MSNSLQLSMGMGGSSQGYPVFPAGTKLVSLGDSITSGNNFSQLNGNMVSSKTNGILNWALKDNPTFKHQIWTDPSATSGATPLYFRGANFGIEGDTATMVNARLTPVINTGAPLVVLLVGTNTGVTDASSAVKIARINDILTTLTAAGKYVLIGTILPRRTRASPVGYEITPAHMVPILETNAYIRTLNKSFGGKVFVWDAWDDLIDPQWGVDHANYGSCKDIYTLDGVHLTPLGASQASKSLRAILSQMGTTDPWSNAWFDTNIAQAGNCLTNGKFTGTSGTVSNGVTGTAATNMLISGVASGRNCTGVASLIANAKTGGFTQRVVLTCDGLGGGVNSETMTVQFQGGQISTASLSSGDWVSLFVKVKISGNNAGILGAVMANVNNGSTGKYGRGMEPYSTNAIKTYPNPTDNQDVWICTEPIQWNTGNSLFVQVYLYIVEANAGSCTLDFEGAILKKVPAPATEFPYIP